jgi:hypothetical protein
MPYLCNRKQVAKVTLFINLSEVSDGSLMSEKVPISALLPHKTQNNEDKDSSFQEHGVRRGTNHDE